MSYGKKGINYLDQYQSLAQELMDRYGWDRRTLTQHTGYSESALGNILNKHKGVNVQARRYKQLRSLADMMEKLAANGSPGKPELEPFTLPYSVSLSLIGEVLASTEWLRMMVGGPRHCWEDEKFLTAAKGLGIYMGAMLSFVIDHTDRDNIDVKGLTEFVAYHQDLAESAEERAKHNDYVSRHRA